MTTDTTRGDVAILNMGSRDESLHSNLLLVYQDEEASPSCTAAFVGHMLRYAGGEAIPFASGNLIATVPFRIETSRLGKPVTDVTYGDLASLKNKYELEQDTQFTMLLRKDVLAPPEQLLAQDIEHYAKIFNDQRAVDIETVCLEAEAEARQLKVQPDSPVCLLFGIEVLPAPVESAIFSLSIAEGREPFVKAYALLWHLIRRDRYGAKLRNASHSGAGGTAAIELGIHPGNDGMCCIGLRRRNPLMLLGQESELAHFHGVASSIAEAREIGRVSAELISRQFDVDVKVELMESAPKRSGPYDAENT